MKKEKVIKLKDGDRVIKSYPQVINDVNCDHYYQDDYLDNDGHQHCQCQYCMMGRLYDPKNAKLVNGKVVEL